MKTLPRITILLPVYNGEKYIQYAIISILKQTLSNFELLIIDDGSTDATHTIVTHFTDSRIRYLYIEHTGLSGALNYGLQHAACDIVARMDADDVSLSGRLEQQLKIFVDAAENTVLSCRYVLFDNEGVQCAVHGPADHDAIVKRLVLHNELTHSGIMYNRKFILQEGGYSDLPFEDYELWLRLRNKAHFAIVPRILSCVRLDYSSLARTNIRQQNSLVYKLLEPLYAAEKFPDEFGLVTEKDNAFMRGWREYFYGNKKAARKYWRQFPLELLKNSKVCIAYLATILPEKAFISFKENRFRFRLEYYLRYSHELSGVEASLHHILSDKG